ncbi:MAG: hypothetical protein CL902_01110 [Dehalococcoidia bacterium]|nr:hypothetical protein [Dehalococcoidia bacterium]
MELYVSDAPARVAATKQKIIRWMQESGTEGFISPLTAVHDGSVEMGWKIVLYRHLEPDALRAALAAIGLDGGRCAHIHVYGRYRGCSSDYKD